MATIKKVTLKDGSTRYRVRFYSGRNPETGKEEVITRTFEKWKDADREVTRLKRMRDKGGVITPSKEPLGKYLKDWLHKTKKGSLRARTFSDYVGVLDRYIHDPPKDAPRIGRVRLHQLTPGAIQDLYHHLQEEEGLSPRTIRSLHAVIRQGLAHAARVGAVGRNVADLVVLPKQEKREVKAMSPEEAGKFLEAAKADRYYPLWCVLLTGGLRPGEALALQWPDVDLDAAKIHVQRTLTRRGTKDPWALVEPKTNRARRVVVLSGFVVEALRSWKAQQARERLQLGEEYEDNGFVFASEFGKPLDGANLYARNFRRIMAAAGLGEWEEVEEGNRVKKKVKRFRPAYRLYDLRHTAATLLLRAGVNPKVTSERLGHASVAFTMDVYSASLPDLQEEAADKLETMLGSG